ncbi:recombination protein NinG [Comamonas testosteroni]
MKPFNPKPRPCKACSNSFVPDRPMQSVCSPKCAVKKVRQDKAEERAQVRTRKESIKTLPVLKAEAQVAFNEFIRLRDAGKPCICCGLPLGDGDIGGAYDCGHYRSVGSAPQHRFNELNAHAQRKQCNRWGAGRAVDYRIGLMARIGLEAVEALEADNAVKKFTAEELREIRATYKAKAKELKKERA